MKFLDGSDPNKHLFPHGSELPHASEHPQSTRTDTFDVRLIQQNFIPFLESAAKEKDLYTGMCGERKSRD